MRTSLRTPENRSPKQILVPDRGLAEYLHDVFPGSEVKKLDIGLVEDVPRRRGRPRRHHSNQERLAQQRQKAKERQIQILAEQLRLNSPDAIGEEDWRNEGARSQTENGGTSRAENGIRLYTNFGSGPLTATIFRSTSSSIPACYASGETEAFIGFLRDCHERRTNSKDENFLFSPAIFDPDRSAGTNRCARAANGHVTLAPISAMNSRRLIVSPSITLSGSYPADSGSIFLPAANVRNFETCMRSSVDSGTDRARSK
jgi:hypothetical protein